MSAKGKVLVAMSGGIDSTIAAVMLQQQGYEVIGITMKTWDYATSGGSSKETGCCSLDSINDARQAAVDFGFPHFIIDIRDEFGDFVIDNFVDEYLAGRTPNPCILCNTHIKWEALLKRADSMGCDFIATGHYAKIQNDGERYWITKAKDLQKDQSYVLWGVSQKCLKRTLFPLENYVKQQVRDMALEMGYVELANKSESYEICFVPDNDYRSFLKRRVYDLEEKVADGTFIDSDGNVLGKHKGYPFFTVGQRKGLGVALGKPMYVTQIDPVTNTVVLGEEDELMKSGMWVKGLNMQKYGELTAGTPSTVKVRYLHPGAEAELEMVGDRMKVEFKSEVSAIAPGQSAVFYEGDDIIGGGVIHSSFEREVNI